MSETPSRHSYRSIAIALCISSFILIAGLVIAVANYTSMIGGKDDIIATKESQIQTFTIQKNQLQTCLDSNITLLNSTSAERDELEEWLDENKTMLDQTQIWLDGNTTALNSACAYRDELQSWLDGNITFYSSQLASLNSQIANLQNQITSLNAEKTTLQNQVNSLNSQVASLNSQIANLQDTVEDLQDNIDALEAAKLIKVDLKSDDNRPWLGTYYLHVYGHVCNVGTNVAYDSKVHVVAYQSGGVVAIDTYIVLGTIWGESYANVDGKPTYSGGALTSWSLTLTWTTS